MPIFGQSDGQLVISLREARKLLGQKSKNLTNGELEALIKTTETVVRISVREFIGSKNSKNDDILDSEKVNTI